MQVRWAKQSRIMQSQTKIQCCGSDSVRDRRQERISEMPQTSKLDFRPETLLVLLASQTSELLSPTGHKRCFFDVITDTN
jgi:hypothetical protein